MITIRNDSPYNPVALDEFSPDFRCVLLERVNSPKNEARFYYLAWQPTLFDAGAVVRVWGRKGGHQRVLARPFDSLAEAWPTIQAIIKTRLKHGYRLIQPGEVGTINPG